MQQNNQQGGVVAGYPTQDDVVTGAKVESARGKSTSRTTTSRGGKRVSKNKSRNKGQSSQKGSSGDVVSSSNERIGTNSTSESRKQLIDKIKSIPDTMLPAFVKKYAETLVNQFKLDTPERVANFFGQIVHEGTRGTSESVYYTSGKRLKEVFKSRVTPAHQKNFIYSDKNVDLYKNYGFLPYDKGGRAPWQIGSWLDLYYGGRYGLTQGQPSAAVNDYKNIENYQKIKDRTPNSKFDSYLNPFHYKNDKGSPDGYAYRGHGIIQLTFIGKYQRMNEMFGVNGKYEKNNIDFVKNPERVAYDWGNTSEPLKWAVLGSLLFWEDNESLYANKVSLATTQMITRIVKGSSENYQKRHKSVEDFYRFLKSGIPVKQKSSVLYKNEVIVKLSPARVKFVGGDKLRTGIIAKNELGLMNFSNLSFFESNGRPTPPYKGDGFADQTNPKSWRVFTISKDNIAKIYRSIEMTPTVWANTKYACGGSNRLLDDKGNAIPESVFEEPYRDKTTGKINAAGKSFLRQTGRTAIGIMPGGTEIVIIVLKSSKMGNLSSVVKSYGCESGINFDGGGSTFVWENGVISIPSTEGTDGRPVSTFMSWI